MAIGPGPVIVIVIVGGAFAAALGAALSYIVRDSSNIERSPFEPSDEQRIYMRSVHLSNMNSMAYEGRSARQYP
jgi:hypothetical protein